MSKREIFERFNSLQELTRVLKSRTLNKVFDRAGEESSQERGRKSFFYTESYEEAEDLMKNGYKDILDDVKQGMKDHERSVDLPIKKRHRIVTAVEGYIPHVPNMLMGLPNSMMRPLISHQKVRAITIYYQMSVIGSYSTSDIIKAGVCLLNIINHLERNGIRVRVFNLFKCSRSDDEIGVACVKIKDFNEHIDIQKMCFPIAHPSMFRRFGFRWLETHPDIEDRDWTSGYGVSLDNTDCEEFMKKHGMDKNDVLILASDISDLLDRKKSFDFIYEKYGFHEMSKDVA